MLIWKTTEKGWLKLKLNRPKIEIIVYEIFGDAKIAYWNRFKKHHYLNEDLNKASRCWVAEMNGELVGFNSVLALPSGTLKNAYREHRLVVLADFQGMGIGTNLSECIGEIMLSEGKRFYSKTVNPKLGEYRNRSSKWRPTSKNGKRRPDILKKKNNHNNLTNPKLSMRLRYSHEYQGNKINKGKEEVEN